MCVAPSSHISPHRLSLSAVCTNWCTSALSPASQRYTTQQNIQHNMYFAHPNARHQVPHSHGGPRNGQCRAVEPWGHSVALSYANKGGMWGRIGGKVPPPSPQTPPQICESHRLPWRLWRSKKIAPFWRVVLQLSDPHAWNTLCGVDGGQLVCLL